MYKKKKKDKEMRGMKDDRDLQRKRVSRRETRR